MNMKLPLDRIYLFPELGFNFYNRSDLEEILNAYFSYMRYNGDKIVSLLNRLYEHEVKNQAMIMLNGITISEEDFENLKTEDLKIED